MSVFIIADIGSNFRNSKELSFKQIELVKKSGCDAAKFQLYSHEELYGYEGDTNYCLPPEWLPELKRCCDENKVEFMCTPFSVAGVGLVDPFVSRHKIASSDFKDWQIWNAMAETRKPIIASTGGAHELEIIPTVRASGAESVTILECVAAYPSHHKEYRLFALDGWKKQGYGVGVSDHTMGLDLAGISISLGASVIERHFDGLMLEEGMNDTPDSCVSFWPNMMREYVETIRLAEKVSLDHIKRPLRCEDDMQTMYRKRIVAKRDITEGEILTLGRNYGFFRVKKPDYRGAPPEAWSAIEGKSAKMNIKQGNSIWIDDVI